MEPVQVLDDPVAAGIALDPLRSTLLSLLAAEPASAAGLAPRMGLTRQKVRYHLKALADHGLVAEVDQRRHGGLTERMFTASATSYVVSPAAMGEAATDPDDIPDRLSAAYLVALGARAVREVGTLIRQAAAAGKRLPTLSIDAEIRFRSATERARFATELERAVIELAARYHDETAPNGRRHRFIALVHPTPSEEPS